MCTPRPPPLPEHMAPAHSAPSVLLSSLVCAVLRWMVPPRSKEKQLLKTMKFPKEYEAKVNLKLIKWEAVKPWIAQRTTELLGMEDEVLISYIFEQLEGKEVRPLPPSPSPSPLPSV